MGSVRKSAMGIRPESADFCNVEVNERYHNICPQRYNFGIYLNVGGRFPSYKRVLTSIAGRYGIGGYLCNYP